MQSFACNMNSERYMLTLSLMVSLWLFKYMQMDVEKMKYETPNTVPKLNEFTSHGLFVRSQFFKIKLALVSIRSFLLRIFGEYGRICIRALHRIRNCLSYCTTIYLFYISLLMAKQLVLQNFLLLGNTGGFISLFQQSSRLTCNNW